MEDVLDGGQKYPEAIYSWESFDGEDGGEAIVSLLSLRDSALTAHRVESFTTLILGIKPGTMIISTRKQLEIQHNRARDSLLT